MKSRLHRMTLFVLYQCCLVAGIAAMPFAFVARRVGLSVPIHRLIAGVGDSYENARRE